MSEKETALLSDDYGRDLASVQALQRKHEGLERDLDALEEKVKTLGLDAAQLVGAQPKSSRVVREKEKEIVDAWNTLKSRVSELTDYGHPSNQDTLTGPMGGQIRGIVQGHCNCFAYVLVISV